MEFSQDVGCKNTRVAEHPTLKEASVWIVMGRAEARIHVSSLFKF